MIHKGTYDGTIYHNPANRFCIISVKTADKEVPLEARSTRRYRDHLIRFVATGYELPRTDAVELELDGEWKQGKYGMQFQVEQWRQIVPRTKSGVEGYLASGLIKGIGPATAALIVSRFGEDTLDILQKQPERLLEIKGITESKLEEIKTSYAESRMLQDLLVLLSPFKITPKTALKIYQYFGPASVDILKKSPFELCQISGFGFLRVDAIVQKNGGDLHDPMRVKGALFWALEDGKGSKGHLFLPGETLQKEALRLLNNKIPVPALRLQAKEVADVLQDMILKGEVVAVKDMLTLRQLLKRDLVSRYTEDEQLTQLAQCLLEQPFSEWYRKRFGHIRGLTRRTAMQMLFHYTQLCPFVPDLRTETDAVFAARNLPLLAGCESWLQVRASVLTTDMDWAQLKESLSISDEFVKQNQNRITDFLLRGGSSLVTPLYNYLQGNDAAIEALRRIMQAELMGQFYVLKYFADDLRREINHPISEQQETAWQKNLALDRGKFIAEEADDFYHTIQIGELPYSTCLSYRTGSQRECLLAAFDSNKKIILIRKGDEIVARACIRLTKGAFQKPTELMLSFADLAGGNSTESGHIVSEKLVLFLERIYTSGINDDEQQEVMEMAVALATQKAAELGAVSVLARRYVNCYARDQYVSSPFYVYISKSKNGQQYLDSLGGAATTSRKEKYVEGAFLVERAALHTAGALPEKEE